MLPSRVLSGTPAQREPRPTVDWRRERGSLVNGAEGWTRIEAGPTPRPGTDHRLWAPRASGCRPGARHETQSPEDRRDAALDCPAAGTAPRVARSVPAPLGRAGPRGGQRPPGPHRPGRLASSGRSLDITGRGQLRGRSLVYSAAGFRRPRSSHFRPQQRTKVLPPASRKGGRPLPLSAAGRAPLSACASPIPPTGWRPALGWHTLPTPHHGLGAGSTGRGPAGSSPASRTGGAKAAPAPAVARRATLPPPPWRAGPAPPAHSKGPGAQLPDPLPPVVPGPVGRLRLRSRPGAAALGAPAQTLLGGGSRPGAPARTAGALGRGWSDPP